MDIKLIDLSLLKGSQTQPIKLEQMPLPVGQKVEAVVQQILSQNQAILQIGDLKVKAELPIPVMLGQILKAEMTKVGAEVRLKLLTDTDSIKNLLQQILRENLPKQNSLVRLVATMAALQEKEVPLPKLPREVQTQIKEFINRLPTQEALFNSKSLKKAIDNNGLFLEKQLKDAAPQAKQDLKANLMRLVESTQQNQQKLPNTPQAAQTQAQTQQAAQTTYGKTSSINTAPQTQVPNSGSGEPKSAPTTTTTQAPPPLKGYNPEVIPKPEKPELPEKLSQLLNLLNQQAVSGLARIQIAQLMALPLAEFNPDPQLSFELPVNHYGKVEFIHFLIDNEKYHKHQHEQEAEDQSRPWHIKMALHLEHLGDVEIHLQIIDDEVSVDFWVAGENKQRFLQRHQDELSDSLEEKGITLANCNTHTGTKAPPPPPPDVGDHLLDIRV